jgi:opacity protein-like surface antigen
MMTRQWLHSFIACAGFLAVTAGSAGAQVYQVGSSDSRNAIGFSFGGFILPGIDSRSEDDTLRGNLLSADPLAFEIKDFNHFTFGGEYLAGVSEFFEIGAGISFYQRTVPSVYEFLVNSNGSEIAQDLKLRMVPITATVRFLPIGRGAGVEPYFGGGIGIFPWRYSESGDFVGDDGGVFSNVYTTDGVEIGPVLLGGVRLPLSDAAAIGIEGRWQQAKGDTGGLDEGFLGEKIDLTGWTINGTLHFRF